MTTAPPAPGTRPHGPDGQLPASASPLLMIAADHRASLERDLYGLTAPATPAQAARITADKLLIYEALLEAVPELPGTVQPGILIDEQYGASVAELASRSDAGISLAVAVEASSQEWFRFAYGGDWQQHAAFFPASHVKALVRDNPGLDAGCARSRPGAWRRSRTGRRRTART
jgi:myo-inositol catabolism protein IolC